MICTSVRRSQPDFSTCTSLSQGARNLATYLNRQTRRYGDVWLGNQHLADALGVCITSIQRWLKELQVNGLVDILKDYALRTRRRILLLWRQPTREAASAPAVVRVDALPTPSPAPAPEPQEKPRAATEEEVNRVTLKAEKLFGPPMRKRVILLARETRLSWVEAALDLAVKTGDVQSWGWVVTVCRNWLFTDGPPPRKASFSDSIKDGVAKVMELIAKREAEREAPLV